MQTDMVVKIFKRMKACGYPADPATYNIMIDCCRFIRSYKSACAIVSMMIRDGFSPKVMTYTSLMKVLTDYNFKSMPSIFQELAISIQLRTYTEYTRNTFSRTIIHTENFQLFSVEFGC